MTCNINIAYVRCRCPIAPPSARRFLSTSQISYLSRVYSILNIICSVFNLSLRGLSYWSFKMCVLWKNIFAKICPVCNHIWIYTIYDTEMLSSETLIRSHSGRWGGQGDNYCWGHQRKPRYLISGVQARPCYYPLSCHCYTGVHIFKFHLFLLQFSLEGVLPPIFFCCF